MYMFLKRMVNTVNALIFRKRVSKMQSRLYDSLDELPVRLFFQIMETGNLRLLKKNQKKVSQEELEKTWNNLRDDYYKKSDKRGYEEDLNKAKKIELYNIEINACNAAIFLYRYFDEKTDIFETFGYKVENIEDLKEVERSLLVLKTKLSRLLANKKEKDEKEAINFWEIVSDVEVSLNKMDLLHGQIDVDKTSTSRWIYYIKTLKKAIIDSKTKR